jgi:hypothetical protein
VAATAELLVPIMLPLLSPGTRTSRWKRHIRAAARSSRTRSGTR